MSSFHSPEAREFTPISAWLFTRAVIGMAGVLSVTPFMAWAWN